MNSNNKPNLSEVFKRRGNYVLNGETVPKSKIFRGDKIIKGIQHIEGNQYTTGIATNKIVVNGELTDYAEKLYKSGKINYNDIKNDKYGKVTNVTGYFSNYFGLLDGKFIKLSDYRLLDDKLTKLSEIRKYINKGVIYKHGKYVSVFGKGSYKIYDKNLNSWNNELINKIKLNNLNKKKLSEIIDNIVKSYKLKSLPKLNNNNIIYDESRGKVNFIDDSSIVNVVPGGDIDPNIFGSLLFFVYEIAYFHEVYNNLRIIHIDNNGFVKSDRTYMIDDDTSPNIKIYYGNGVSKQYNHYVNTSLMLDYQKDSVENKYVNGDKFIFIDPEEKRENTLVGNPQIYRDGIEHCFIQPIINFCNDKLTNSKSKSTIERYKTIINKCERYLEKYINGIPEDDIQLVVDDTRIKVCLYDICEKVYKTFIPSQTALTTLNFINTRYNHLDHFTYKISKDSIKLNKQQMNDKFSELCKNKTFFTFKGCHTSIIFCISTCEYYYEIDDPELIIYSDFLEETDIKNIMFDINEDITLTKFILSGVRFTSHYTINDISDNYEKNENGIICIDSNNDIHSIDMRKAYTQHKLSSVYQGFPSLINIFTNGIFNIEHINNHPGYYYIKNITYKNKNVKKYLEKLQFDNGIYPSCELLLFHKYGVNFDIVAGAYSVVPFHFDWSDKMKTKNSDGIPYYSIATGKLSVIKKYNEINFFNDDKNFKTHLNDLYRDNIIIYNDKITIRYEKKHSYSACHIAGFITAYTRCNLYEKLFNIPYDNVIQIKLDEIIYKGPKINDCDLWREKDDIIKIVPTSQNFYNITCPIDCNYNGDIINNRFCLFNGMGGSGKTHYCLSNKFLVNKMFSAVCWRLIVDKKQKYNVNCRTINRLLGLNGALPYYSMNRHPATIIVDEATQIEGENILLLKKYYPYSLIIVLADIDCNDVVYQCKFQADKTPCIKLDDHCAVKTYEINKNKSVVPCKYSDFGFVKSFNKSFRFKENDKINDLLNDLRESMRKNYNIINEPEKLKIAIELQKKILLKYVKYGDINLYNKYDTILVSTINGADSEVNFYTNKFKHIEKYIITNHNIMDVEKRMNGDDSILLNGEICYEDGPNRELRHAYTIHSVQGLTIETGEKLFLSLNKIFDYQQIYTAVSRVRELSQIVVI